MNEIILRRAYDKPEPHEGRRVLVDRFWPRGIRREALAADLWLKEIAPSAGLCRWFGHDPAKWDEFRRRYAAELDANPGPLQQLRDLIDAGPVTLLYGARDGEHNNAVALRDYLAQ
ncbi:DUF488 family protein [Paracoccus kondratievae]|uniref:DUF488 family protein n=1 Tax=Paracoccus kondratievae TaxID=135740 RepID=A0AAD3RUS0_9RHOB|nr:MULTISPECIES: DUF488 domain-containing protein [Paracoccus]QFQ87635.1 DUF488 family protein [Paracoccus kondratievae]GLK64934.1 hypothetical protein GCM10017635_24050 [Paracoccus kondratievae]SMG24537.1 Uncharacterized conserved protein YeaO, DUF488 family [Paracoccus sp. J56]